MVPEREMLAKNLNLKSSLGLMATNIRAMLKEGNDRVAERYVVRDIDEKIKERLKVILRNIEALSTEIDQAPERTVFNAPIEEICDCPVHQEHLRKIGITSLVSFFFPQRMAPLLDALYAAEAKVGRLEQPHLFTGVLPKVGRTEVFELAKEQASTNRDAEEK